MATKKDDNVMELVRSATPPPLDSAEVKYRELRAVLDNLQKEVRIAAGPRNQLGLKVNVALRMADTVLKRYPEPS